ncbi:C40 family peptidase [Intestinimonas butyriciproducens]|uniref:C40 family peptidase n=1 Tax=Intestinimonas butyriciproducens TaxID=1297617 RepID=UPI001896D394|nr:C40 family peptidase [Intestinimonas butyriciproducens]MDB7831611.1 NlpC/P60 family protein [Intestinimonas butyriciproducens]
MKPLKPRDKITQKMTRDGLTLDNQTTGESVNVSDREAEQDYTGPEPGGASEKVLERAGDIRDHRKAKRAAKDGGEIAAQATGPASRLQFTAEERASPELAPYIQKAEKRADSLDAAREVLPKKRVVTKETLYDEASGRAKSRLHFEKVEKDPPKLKPSPASRPVQEAALFLHGKIHEVERENVGVEGGHKGEELAERQAGRAIRSGIRRHKLKPYRAAAKAERKSIAANAEYIYQKSLRDNPELAQAVKNPVSRFWQKQHIKREYAKAARAAGQTAQGAAKATQASAAAAKKAAEESKRAASFAARHWKGALLVGGVALMLLMVMGGLQSCTAMFGSAGTGIAATSYLSEDSDMLGAEAAYSDMEADLQHELDNYESLHPGYDEYRFDLDEIGHDPYVLTSILSALHEGVFTLDEVRADLAMLFDRQYTLTQTIETETRYRTETDTWTDEDGNTHTDTYEVPYTYYICNVKLENFNLSHLPVYIMGEDAMSLYAAYMHTLGNRPDLFPTGSYPHASTVKQPEYYDVPPEALEDATFAAMIGEAEKYIGFPYVWGGSSPATSFDCSGFLSWVVNHSGWNVGRLGAQGLYDYCTPVSPAQARPGDLVFFVGTYDPPGVSHCGLYVGNNVMLHCGDPISYTNLNSNYWQSHFYSFGRLP